MLLTFVFLNIEKDLLIVIWNKKFHVITIKRSNKVSILYVVVALKEETLSDQVAMEVANGGKVPYLPTLLW